MDTVGTPSVSVIIPTYNRAHLVGRAIRSVLDQTRQDFELIVVDDGSTDKTGRVVRSFTDDRIRYLRHERNRGGAAARNTGIKAARGTYIAFLDSDDEWLPEKLEKQVEEFQRADESVGVVYCAFWWCEEGAKLLSPSPPSLEKEDFQKLIHKRRAYVWTVTAMVRRNVLQAVGGFDERLPRCQETELWMRVSYHYNFAYINEPLVNVYDPGERSLDYVRAHVEARKLILSKHESYINKFRDIKSNYLYEIGNKLCQLGEVSEGRKYLLRALLAYPFFAKCGVAFMLSLFGGRFYNYSIQMRRKYLMKHPKEVLTRL